VQTGVSECDGWLTCLRKAGRAGFKPGIATNFLVYNYFYAESLLFRSSFNLFQSDVVKLITPF